ncbi:Protein unc-93 A [Chamberlinius hualienensis]
MGNKDREHLELGSKKVSTEDVYLSGHDNPSFQHDFKPTPDAEGGKVGTEVTPVPPSERWPIIKNLLAISIGFLLNFTALSALSNIQSSLNSDQGLGTASLSVIYAALVLSCMFVPSTVIKRLGCKWTIPISMVFYTFYMAANFYPTWYTMIPASILMGFGAAPLWSAKCTYLTEIGHQYSKLVGETAEVLIVRFFGVFFMFFQTSQIWGNLASSLVLAPTTTTNATKPWLAPEQLRTCGARYCNEELGVAKMLINGTMQVISTRPELSQVYLLCGICLICSIIAIIVTSVFVNPLQRTFTKQSDLSGVKLMMATFRHLRNGKQLLLIPITIFSGVEQAFITSDFTKAFVSCSLGIHNVGFVMICGGAVDSICSFVFGPVVKYIGRLPIYLFGAAINLALAITMLNWQPDPNMPIVLFVIAGLWGMADAIWQTQINAFYGVLFSNNSEAGFSNYRLWESLGFIIGFAWSSYLCVYIKLYCIIAILCVGILGYVLVEMKLYLENRKLSNVS